MPRVARPVLRRWLLAKYPQVHYVNHPSRRRFALLSALALFSASLTATSALAAVNRAPTISGSPGTYAPRDVLYTFTPSAADPDGNRLTFSVVNKPKWMWFDSRTGRLRGTPKWAQRNRTFSDIVIRVSDGQSVRALPAFSIKVSATSNGGGGGGGSGNSAPTITGIPGAKVKVGQPFGFRPKGADANGDKLTFSITNKPTWALFSVIDGALTGTPDAGDVRSYGNIVISVSDGKATTSLKPFAIAVVAADTATRSVTLNWSAPTRNTDGSALTDLAGYRVFYGNESRAYSTSVAVPGVAANSVELEGFTAGTWYFAIKSINRVGVESDFSGEVRAVL